MVSKELLEELKVIMKDDYGVELQQQELEEMANTLLSFFEVLAKVEYGGISNE